MLTPHFYCLHLSTACVGFVLLAVAATTVILLVAYVMFTDYNPGHAVLCGVGLKWIRLTPFVRLLFRKGEKE